MTNDKKKVYLVAYACAPNQGGEHEVGWRIADELKGKCDLEVVTRISYPRNDANGIKFKDIENNLFLFLKPRNGFSYLYYVFWQISVFLYLRKVVKKQEIVHYITFGNLHLPHFLFLLKSKLIVGPMGGGSVMDPLLMETAPLKEKLRFYVHTIVNLSVRFNPIYHLLFYKSKKIILRTEETLSIVPSMYHNKCSVFLETGVSVKNINSSNKQRRLKKIISTGRIIHSKNFDQAIQIFQKLSFNMNEKLEFCIFGDGPLRKSFEKRYKHVEGLRFLGRISHNEIDALLQEADLFLFCSIKEGGSHSLFEAAINNIPIACYDISGMKEFPRSDASIKIEPTHNIQDNIERLAQKIMEAFKEEEKINQICLNAINDLKSNYTWDLKAKKYLYIYDEVRKN